MTCQECELLLGAGESGRPLEDHLRSCIDCRVLAAELPENAAAFSLMREEPLPPVKLAPARRAATRYVWTAAAAAALAIALFLPQSKRPERLPEATLALDVAPRSVPVPVAQIAATLPHRSPKARPTPPAAPLVVKMLTQDPEVVVYWIVDSKEEVAE